MGITNPIYVLYDKATPKYKRLEIEERHDLFNKIWEGNNPFTTESLGEITETTNRDLILFSSTSYTPDEDFNLVVDALIDVNDKIKEDKGKFLTLNH